MGVVTQLPMTLLDESKIWGAIGMIGDALYVVTAYIFLFGLLAKHIVIFRFGETKSLI